MHHCLNFLGLDFIYGHTWIECIRIFSTWPCLTIFWTLASKIASLVCYISSPTGIQSKLKHNAHKKVHLNRTRNVWISFMFLLLFWRCALKPICTYAIQNYMVGFWLLSPFLIILRTKKRYMLCHHTSKTYKFASWYWYFNFCRMNGLSNMHKYSLSNIRKI